MTFSITSKPCRQNSHGQPEISPKNKISKHDSGVAHPDWEASK
jgi:hypothetical protein